MVWKSTLEKINVPAKEWNEAIKVRVLRGDTFVELPQPLQSMYIFQALEGYLYWRNRFWHINAWTPPGTIIDDWYVEFTEITREHYKKVTGCKIPWGIEDEM